MTPQATIAHYRITVKLGEGGAASKNSRTPAASINIVREYHTQRGTAEFMLNAVIVQDFGTPQRAVASFAVPTYTLSRSLTDLRRGGRPPTFHDIPAGRGWAAAGTAGS